MYGLGEQDEKGSSTTTTVQVSWLLVLTRKLMQCRMPNRYMYSTVGLDTVIRELFRERRTEESCHCPCDWVRPTTSSCALSVKLSTASCGYAGVPDRNDTRELPIQIRTFTTTRTFYYNTYCSRIGRIRQKWYSRTLVLYYYYNSTLE